MIRTDRNIRIQNFRLHKIIEVQEMILRVQEVVMNCMKNFKNKIYMETTGKPQKDIIK